MTWLAWKMLIGDRFKCLALVFGVAFATLLMTQQLSLFRGIMIRTGSQILDVRDAEVWVMDPHVRYVDEASPLSEADLQRARSVPGVCWALPLFTGTAQARLEDGELRAVQLTGVDDYSLVGGPQQMLLGSLRDLTHPDGVIIDEVGYRLLWPGEPLRRGRTFEINQRRCVVVAVCRAEPPFVTMPVLFARYSHVERLIPHRRRLMTYILAQPHAGQAGEEVCRRIRAQTGLQALTRDQFVRKTATHYLLNTGIATNFAITVGLGFMVGLAVCGQTFYLFMTENLKQFGALKAMGLNNRSLVGMALTQALAIGASGYCIGLALAVTFFEATRNVPPLRGMEVCWQIAAGVAGAVLLIVTVTALFSVRRALILEPAMVFR